MFKTALLLVTILVPTSAIARESDQIADMAVVNAEIWTGDPDNPFATAIAVRDGKFVAVGNEDDIQRWVSPDTKIIDAEGKRVLPGLIDTHVHLANAASDMRHLDLRPATSKKHLLTMLSEYAEQFDEDAWVVGTRWSAESWPTQQPPTAEEIDDAVEGRKAMLVRMDGHSIIVSKSTLEYCGITIDGPADPPGGSIGRLEDGTPTGAIYEQAQSFINKHVQLPEVNSIDLLRKAIAEANKNGITQVGAIESIATIKELVQLDNDSLLTLKIAATVRGGGDKVSDWESSLQWAVDNPKMSDLPPMFVPGSMLVPGCSVSPVEACAAQRSRPQLERLIPVQGVDSQVKSVAALCCSTLANIRSAPSPPSTCKISLRSTTHLEACH